MTTHNHPKVSQKDVASLNAAHAPWRIEKARNAPNGMHTAGTNQWLTQVRNMETGEVIYKCEGWSQASRGLALVAILERETEPAKLSEACTLIRHLTAENVTEAETAEVIAWCREWVADAFEDGKDAAYGSMRFSDAAILRRVNSRIDGGLAFVLSDVRRIANDARQGIDRNCPACAAQAESGPWPDHSPGCPDSPEAAKGVLAIEPQEDAGATETAREDSVQVQALRAGARSLLYRAERYASLGRTGHADKATADARELERMANKLAAITANPPAGGCQDEDYPRCPACGEPIDYCQGHGPSGDPIGFAILEAHDAGEHSQCDPAGCDDARELDAIESAAELADESFVANPPTVPSVATIAARIARDAAKTWKYDSGEEDAEGAAQRAADILRDLSPEDVPGFLLRVFGLPMEERHASREYTRLTLHADPSEDWARWHALAEDARVEAGFPDAARVLIFEYRDVIEPLAFAGHYAVNDLVSESTNLSAWREAWAAWDRVQALRAHAFGGNSLDGWDRHIGELQEATIAAALDALRWAAFNNANTEPVYQDEPRSE